MLYVPDTLNLPACLSFVPGPVESKDGSFSVLMAGQLELFTHSEHDFPSCTAQWSIRAISC